MLLYSYRQLDHFKAYRKRNYFFSNVGNDSDDGEKNIPLEHAFSRVSAFYYTTLVCSVDIDDSSIFQSRLDVKEHVEYFYQFYVYVNEMKSCWNIVKMEFYMVEKRMVN